MTWAILVDGSRVLLHMELGAKESYEDSLEHSRGLVRRGLSAPLTVTTDGAPGLTKAVEAIWPEADRIRCWVHKMPNVLDKVPEEVRDVLKARLQAVRDAPDWELGKQLADEVIRRFEREYPSAMKSFQEDLEASLADLHLPPIHRKSVRTTNTVERSFLEERRRAKVIPKFRTENEGLKLVFATLPRASERWRAVPFTEIERKQLEKYRAQKAAGRESAQPETATVA